MKPLRLAALVVAGLVAGVLVGWIAARDSKKAPVALLNRPAIPASARLPGWIPGAGGVNNICDRTPCTRIDSNGLHPFPPLFQAIKCIGHIESAPGCFRARTCLTDPSCEIESCSCTPEPVDPGCLGPSSCSGRWCIGRDCVAPYPMCSAPHNTCPADAHCMKVRNTGNVLDFLGPCPPGTPRMNPPPDFPSAECRCVPI